MLLYTITEPKQDSITPGWDICQGEVPCVTLGPGVQARIEGHLQTLAREGAGHGMSVLKFADIDYRNGEYILTRETKKFTYAALVNLHVAPGVGGEVYLSGERRVATACWSDGKEGRHPCVTTSWEQWPPVGVTADPHAEVERSGRIKAPPDTPVPLVLGMIRGASFRVYRTGELDGAPREFVVRWTGKKLQTIIYRR